MSADKVEFYLNNQSYPYLKSYLIRYDVLAGASEFSVETSRDAKIYPVVKETPFEWRINGKTVMKGFVDKIETSYRKGSFSQTFSGRDMMQIWLDNYILFPKIYEGKTLQYIIDDVWNTSKSVSVVKVVDVQNPSTRKDVKLANPMELYPVTYKVTERAEVLLKKVGTFSLVRTDFGQTIFEFVSNLVNSIGLYLYNVPGTDVILIDRLFDPDSTLISYDSTGSLIKDPPYPIRNIPGKECNVIECNYTMDTAGFYKYFKIVGQAESEMTLSADTGNFDNAKSMLRIDKIESDNRGSGDYLSGYKGLKRFKTVNLNSVDLNVWSKAREQLVNNALVAQARELYNFKYTVMGHSKDGGDPYYVNRLCTVEDQFLIPDFGSVSMMIYRVEFEGSKDRGRTTKLELCLPGMSGVVFRADAHNHVWDSLHEIYGNSENIVSTEDTTTDIYKNPI